MRESSLHGSELELGSRERPRSHTESHEAAIYRHRRTREEAEESLTNRKGEDSVLRVKVVSKQMIF